MYTLHYYCPQCDRPWFQYWPHPVDDDCPSCSSTYSPEEIEDSDNE